MKPFLRKLASSVIRPTPNVHPFAESIYPVPLHASSERLSQAPEISVATSREETASPSPLLQSPTFTPTRSPHSEVQSWLNAMKSSTQSENASPHEQNYFRPLLPVLETRHTEPNVQGVSVSRSRSVPNEDSRKNAASPPIVGPTRLAQDESLPAKQVAPLRLQFDAQSLLALRKPTSAAAPFVSRAQQETRTGDDIRINIGRIEVIAVPPSSPRATPASIRKGLSLDEFLNRRNGRAG